MSSFTRPFLKAIGLTDDQITATMESHVAVVNEIKADRDKYKTEADKIPDLQKQLEEAQQAAGDDAGYKKKYDDLVAENAAKESRKAKTAAVRKLMEDTGVGSQYIDLLLRAGAADIDKLEMDGDKLKDADTIAKSLKESGAKYITTKGQKGPKTPTPPKTDGGQTMTRDEIMAIKDTDERREAIKEHIELFQ